MEPLLILGAFGLGTYWLGAKAVRAVAARREARATRQIRENVTVRARQEAERRLAQARQRGLSQVRAANTQARNLQLALLHLSQSPDFRRAASFAAAATVVPRAFRQRQFRRFKTQIIGYFTSRLRAGGDAAVLTESLETLLEGLAIPSFEADYIRTEAERRIALPRRTAPMPYTHQLAALVREHEQRMAAIRAMPNADADTLEQLQETEVSRHREALQALGESGSEHPNS